MKKIYLNMRFMLKPIGLCLLMTIGGGAVMAQEADSTAVAQVKVGGKFIYETEFCRSQKQCGRYENHDNDLR